MSIKRNWKFYTLVCLAVIFILLVLVSGCIEEEVDNTPADNNGEGRPFIENVEIRGHPFEMELALTPEERSRGLMWRENLAENRGMLFVFPAHSPYPIELNFWMKNCLMPIDVIFLDSEGRVTTVHEMEPPASNMSDEELPVYPSNGPAQYAIELRGGLAAELGLQVGDLIDLRKDYLLCWAE